MALVDEIEQTLNKYNLIGCSCCASTWQYLKDYPDACPLDEDGDPDHSYDPPDCGEAKDRVRILAELVDEMLTKRGVGV